jgi:ubiquinone/menaquinone biosynthesis C-methylase UbiE
VHISGADLDALIDAVSVDETMCVLDAGCGAGHTGLALAPEAGSIVAYDLSSAMLAQVERLATTREITTLDRIQGDVEQLPFADNSFERVVTRYSAHHWPDPQAALHEFARVLKPGGLFVISDIIAPPDPAADTFLQTLEMLRDPSHVRDHSISQWETMLRTAGFTPQIIQKFYVDLNFGRWLARINTPDPLAVALRYLFSQAAEDIRLAFTLPETLPDDDDFGFRLPGAVIQGTPDAS